MSSPNYNAYVQDHIYRCDSSVSFKTSFDFFVTSPIRGNIHQQDYFIFLGFQVLHHDLEPIFLKGTVGIWSTYLLVVEMCIHYSSNGWGRRTGHRLLVGDVQVDRRVQGFFCFVLFVHCYTTVHEWGSVELCM
jgi:hypothetical protein